MCPAGSMDKYDTGVGICGGCQATRIACDIGVTCWICPGEYETKETLKISNIHRNDQ